MSRKLICWALAVAAFAVGSAQAQAPDLSRLSPSALTALMHDMPKGGELHLHLAGAVFPESMLDWAAEDGLCIDTKALAFTPPPCAPERDERPAAEAVKDLDLRSAMIDSLTTRKPGFMGRSGHDQFFSTFARFDAVTDRRHGDMLAEVLDRLGRQNTFYVELMVTPQSAAARAVAEKAGWTDDLQAEAKAVKAAGIDAVVPAAMAETDEMEARARKLMECGTAQAHPGCRVTVRYLVQTIRVIPRAQTFSQIALGVALIQSDPRWVGLQIVAPEDSPTALRLYDLHMRMMDVLTDHGRLARTALHAGELTPGYATPEQLSFHIREAVEVGHASRIGHGVDIAHEQGAEQLVAEMAGKGVLVEINPTSNAVILGVEGKGHPYAWLRAHGVPTSLSTDDPGILRIDLSNEYARAAGEGAGYADLEASARNAIAYSFLPGRGLWRDPGVYADLEPACRADLGQEQPRQPACRKLIDASAKAREQWRHEWLLARFKVEHPGLFQPG
jgi:adenosine deaminase